MSKASNSKTCVHFYSASYLQKQPWSLPVVWWSAWSTAQVQWPGDHCTLSSCKVHVRQLLDQYNLWGENWGLAPQKMNWNNTVLVKFLVTCMKKSFLHGHGILHFDFKINHNLLDGPCINCIPNHRPTTHHIKNVCPKSVDMWNKAEHGT
jgi:hypothetical protein